MNINFFTPIIYNYCPSLRQKVSEVIDRYFCLNGRVTEVIKTSKKGHEKVVIKKENMPFWLTAFKIMTYFTLVFPLFLLIAKVILRCSSTYNFKISQYPKKQEINDEQLKDETGEKQEIREIKQEPETQEKPETSFLPVADNQIGKEIPLPAEMKKEILSYLKPEDLRNITLLNKAYQCTAEEAKIAWLNHNKACIFKLGLSFEGTVNLLKKRELGKKLECLHVHNMSQALEFIKYCPNLKQLVIKSKEVKSEDLIKLVSYHFPYLEELTIHRWSTRDDILEGIRAFSAASVRFPNLKSLNLKKIIQYDDEMEILAASPILLNLHTLSIHKGGKYNKHKSIQSFLDIPFTYLETLDLDGYYIDTEIMAKLADNTNLSNLKILKLSNNAIDDPHAEQFANSPNFTKLERIEIYRNYIGPEGLEKLMDSSNLPHLTFIGVTLSDYLVKKLKPNPNLHKLNIEPFKKNYRLRPRVTTERLRKKRFFKPKKCC